MIIIFSFFTLLYAFIVLKLHVSWNSINLHSSYTISKTKSPPFLSVIIPVRNESDNIINLLYDINKQDIDLSTFEVIVIDDASTDCTVEKVLEYQEKLNFKLKICHLVVEEGFTGSHKKKALSLGIANSSGEYIVTTDGDCRVQPHWLASLQSFIAEKTPACVTGPVTFEKEGILFKDMQILEFAFLIGTGASSLQMSFPNMCNGANMSFSRKAFKEVKGYEDNEHIASGDDEFLMHKIYKKFPDKVYFLKSKDFIVSTKAKDDLKSLFFQRRRWAGKWKMYSDIRISLFAAFYFLFNLVFLMVFLMTLFGKYPVGIFIVQTLVRFVIDYVFLKSVMQFLNQPFSTIKFVFAEFLYPFYIIVLGIASNFGKYEWKGRKII